MSANATNLPEHLARNPRLDRWIGFPSAGNVAVFTGRVEIGQGVATAMVQIAAEELSVHIARIVLTTGDTALTPNEGYTAGSMSMQYGGIALRAACAEVRALFLQAAAEKVGCPVDELSIADGAISFAGGTTGEDYWTLAPRVNLSRAPSGLAPSKPVADYDIVGTSLARVDLPAKVFGQPAYIHDLVLDGMRHARVIRQPSRTASIQSVDEAAIRKAAKGPVEFCRSGNFLAVVGDDETVVDAAAAAADGHVAWSGVEEIAAHRAEAGWLLQQPSLDTTVGTAEADATGRGLRRYESTVTRPYVAHASIGPSCGIALYVDGHLTVWSHSQGVFPLRDALVRSLKLDVAAVTVRHAEGPGCYGHNGADDAAADAAIIALHMPGRPVRVRWRREEEFGFEPVSPAMVVKVQAVLDESGRPAHWTQEIWSGPHTSRPGNVGNLLGTEALPNPPPPPVRGSGLDFIGGGIRNGEPLYAIPSMRLEHHLVPDTPVRTSALRGLGATANIFAIETAIDDLAHQAGEDPIAYRLSMLRDQRARAVIERAAAMAGWTPSPPGGEGWGQGIGFARYKNSAAYVAVIAEVEVEENIHLLNIWCAADAGLIINPDGALNQLEGNIIQGASWALKEHVRLGGQGIASRDWEGYPVLRFTEVPEIEIALVEPQRDLPPLGVGEASGAPTVAAIANAASHALGMRLRDLPLTRDRIVATILA